MRLTSGGHNLVHIGMGSDAPAEHELRTSEGIAEVPNPKENQPRPVDRRGRDMRRGMEDRRGAAEIGKCEPHICQRVRRELKLTELMSRVRPTIELVTFLSRDFANCRTVAVQ